MKNAVTNLPSSNRKYGVGIARAFGGAIIFGLPLLMTMEMWFLGFAAHPARLLLFLAVNLVVLIGLSRFGGFEHTFTLFEDILDALAASGVGVISSAAALGLLGLLQFDMPLEQIVGMIAIQSIPASFGAMLARKQLSAGDPSDEGDEDEKHAARTAGHGAQLFLMMAGALFLAFNAAPTEEIMLISFQMDAWHSLALMLVSVLLLHAFVFAVGFAGRAKRPKGHSFRQAFFAHTIPGYGIALLVSVYVLWTFGRADGGEFSVIAGAVVVLAFPAAVGAAISRLVV